MKHEDTVENGSKRLDFQLSSVHFTGLHSWTSGKSVRGTFCTQKCKVTWPPIGFTWNTRRAHTVNPRAVSTGGTALRKYGPVFHPPLSPPPPRPHSTSFSLSLSSLFRKSEQHGRAYRIYQWQMVSRDRVSLPVWSFNECSKLSFAQSVITWLPVKGSTRLW